MWNLRYSEKTYAYGKKPNDFLVTASKLLPPGKVLCLGEGEGRNAVFLARQGYDVFAVDSSEVGLKKARDLANKHHVSVSTIVADLAQFIIEPDDWNGIINIFCHLPTDLRRILHRQVVSGLKPGGVFVLEAYALKQQTYNSGGPKQPDLLMDIHLLKNELDGLLFIHALETERDIYEGKYHTGKSAVVQIITKKQ